MADKSVSGFVQNVSPIRSGPKKNFFSFTVQTESDESVRAICFSPPKRELFAECETNCTPVKIRKFVNDNKHGSTDISMGDNIVVEKLSQENVSFEKQNLLSADLNLSMLSTISSQQLVTLKAKLLHLQKEEMVNKPQGTLKMVEGLLVDEHGSVKINFWVDDAEKVVVGETYEFRNLRIKKKMNGKLYVNPAKGLGTFSKCEEFKGNLYIPDYDPDSLLTCTLDNPEIAGVIEVHLQHCCIKCNAHVKDKKITTCQNSRCKLIQRLDKCKRHWFAKALVTEDDVSVYLIFRGDVLLEALCADTNDNTLTKEIVTKKLLLLDATKITYHSRPCARYW